MIAKISRGSDTVGLLRYLFGPGRSNEHTNPHLVGAWDQGQLTALEPTMTGTRHEVKPLAGLLDQPVAALNRRPTSTVWHCSLRTAPEDRQLTDAEWNDCARTALARVGLADDTDTDGCRWVAVRHADDHIHLLVTLARQDGTPARTPHDYRKVGAACRDLEQRYGLRATKPRESTVARRPTRAEDEKAVRAGLPEASRHQLRRRARVAAFGAAGLDEYFDRLEAGGVLVRRRFSTQTPSEITGYALAWPRDRNRQGEPVWFGGGQLAPELSLPRLLQAWGNTPGRESGARKRPIDYQTPSSRSIPWGQVNYALRRARFALASETLINHPRQDVERALVLILVALTSIRPGPRRQWEPVAQSAEVRLVDNRRATIAMAESVRELATAVRLIGAGQHRRGQNDALAECLSILALIARSIESNVLRSNTASAFKTVSTSPCRSDAAAGDGSAMSDAPCSLPRKRRPPGSGPRGQDGSRRQR